MNANQILERRIENGLEHLHSAVEHANRREWQESYCRGLTLQLAGKNLEPTATSIPYFIRAGYRSLHHFAAKSDWSASAILKKGSAWALPKLSRSGVEHHWIINEIRFINKGSAQILEHEIPIKNNNS